MKIYLAEHSGFCFGVKRAIKIAEEQISSAGPDDSVYSLGHLIHNRQVTDDLESKGLMAAECIDDVPDGSVVIIRSHGEGKDVYDRAREKGVRVVDATCPFVSRIHDLVNAAYNDGKKVIIAGDADHPEVRGINGWCGGSAYIMASGKDAENFDGEKAFVVSQTTMKPEVFSDILGSLESGGIEVEAHSTIC
ncbi:MAG: 4-hydroxy-3-methylbut-2-enyl diphosphate reductase, partial [Anaerovoracaceae bacterium]